MKALLTTKLRIEIGRNWDLRRQYLLGASRSNVNRYSKVKGSMTLGGDTREIDSNQLDRNGSMDFALSLGTNKNF